MPQMQEWKGKGQKMKLLIATDGSPNAEAGMRDLVQAADAQLRIGESIITIARMDSGLSPWGCPGMTLGVGSELPSSQ